MIDKVFSMNDAVGATGGIRLLVSADKRQKPELFKFAQPFAVIGRSQRADVSLPHAGVSYRHAYLQVVGGRIFCVDLHSKSGTYWGEERQSHGWVTPRDKLCIGPYTLRLAPAKGTAVESNGSPPDPLTADADPILSSPRYDLEFFDDNLPDLVRSIDRPLTLVGRKSRCAIQIEDQSVSGIHCAFVRTMSGLWIVDLIGKGGTFVDEKRVRSSVLENGSELEIGNRRMCVWQHGSTAATDPGKGSDPESLPAVEEHLPKSDPREWLGTLFSIEYRDQTLIIVPTISGGMFRYAKLQTEANALRRKMEESAIRGLVIDLHALTYLGAEVIGAVVALARKAEEIGSRVVMCRAEPQLKTALSNMGLHRLWSVLPSREDAIVEVENRQG